MGFGGAGLVLRLGVLGFIMRLLCFPTQRENMFGLWLSTVYAAVAPNLRSHAESPKDDLPLELGRDTPNLTHSSS